MGSKIPIRFEYITDYKATDLSDVLVITDPYTEEDMIPMAIPTEMVGSAIKSSKNFSLSCEMFLNRYEDFILEKEEEYSTYHLPETGTYGIFVTTCNYYEYGRSSTAIRYPWGYAMPKDIVLHEINYLFFVIMAYFFLREVYYIIYNHSDQIGLHSFFLFFVSIVMLANIVSLFIRDEFDYSLAAVYIYSQKAKYAIYIAAILFSMSGPPLAPLKWRISKYFLIGILFFTGRSVYTDIIVNVPFYLQIRSLVEKQRHDYYKFNIAKTFAQEKVVGSHTFEKNFKQYCRFLKTAVFFLIVTLIELNLGLRQGFWFIVNVVDQVTITIYVFYFDYQMKKYMKDEENKNEDTIEVNAKNIEKMAAEINKTLSKF